MAENPEKILLAYSGGLDTSVILTWLKETYEAEVIAFSMPSQEVHLIGDGQEQKPFAIEHERD